MALAAVEAEAAVVDVQGVGALAIAAMAGDALAAHAGELIVGVAVAARRDEVAAAQRELGAIVIEAHQPPDIRAMAVAAVDERAAAVRIAVAGAAVRIEPRHARNVVTGRAADGGVATIEREQRLRVIERRHVGEAGRLVAARAVGAELIAVARRVAGGAADLYGRAFKVECETGGGGTGTSLDPIREDDSDGLYGSV